MASGSSYPSSLDTFTNRAKGYIVPKDDWNLVQDAIENIQAELGISPSGGSATVKARLDAQVMGVNLSAAVAGKIIHFASTGVPAAIGGLTLAGSEDTEATTTSTSTADLVTVGSLSIPKTSTALIIASLRRSTGAANFASVGLKFNGTAIKADRRWSSAGNATEQGSATFLIPAHDSVYLNTGWTILAALTQGAELTQIDSSQLPDATLTEIIITGKVADGAITMGVQNVRVYSLAGS